MVAHTLRNVPSVAPPSIDDFDPSPGIAPAYCIGAAATLLPLLQGGGAYGTWLAAGCWLAGWLVGWLAGWLVGWLLKLSLCVLLFFDVFRSCCMFSIIFNVFWSLDTLEIAWGGVYFHDEKNCQATTTTTHKTSKNSPANIRLINSHFDISPDLEITKMKTLWFFGK